MKKATMTDVARLAGVSQSTVSFVLGNENQSISADVQKRVHDAIKQLQYVPRAKARNYAKAPSQTIALFIPNFSNMFYPELMKHVDFYASRKGFRVFIVNANRDTASEQHHVNLVIDLKVTGVVFGYTPSVSSLQRLKEVAVPVVVIGETEDAFEGDTVNLSGERAGLMMANHLLGLGHKNIAVVTSPVDRVSLSRQKRLTGIRNGLEGKAELSVYTEAGEQELPHETYEIALAHRQVEKICALTANRPTAIIGTNDTLAYGVLNALKKLGIDVPGQMSVCGFDNLVLSSLFSPTLTTVDYYISQRCRLAMDLLEDKIEKRSSASVKVSYEPLLVVRESTGKPNVKEGSHQ